MANKIGTYTIRQVLGFTKESKFDTRFEYRDRDVNKGIRISLVKRFNPFNLLKESTQIYRIETRSYPQYYPYNTIKGNKSKKQRKIHHDYDVILEIDRLSIDTTNWQMRVGSQKRLRDAPSNALKSSSLKEISKWKKEAERKFKTNKEKSDYIKKKREDKKQRGKYLNQGDWVARVLGINLDWIYRAEFVYSYYGHLKGVNRAKTPPKKTNPKMIMFFTKHQLRVVEILMKAGKLKEG